MTTTKMSQEHKHVESVNKLATCLTGSSYPHQVSLLYNGNHICGGTLLDATTVLTAAHCIIASSGFSVRAGATFRSMATPSLTQSSTVSRIVVHSEYSKVTYDFPIDRKMLPEIRKHFEKSTQLLGRWLTIADDFFDSAVHKLEIEREYNGRNADAHSQAISKTLEIWLSLGRDVATFNKLVGIIVDYDPACAARLREDEDRIKKLGSD